MNVAADVHGIINKLLLQYFIYERLFVVPTLFHFGL